MFLRRKKEEDHERLDNSGITVDSRLSLASHVTKEDREKWDVKSDKEEAERAIPLDNHLYHEILNVIDKYEEEYTELDRKDK